MRIELTNLILQISTTSQQSSQGHILYYLARAERFELPSKVLETRMLPLHHTRISTISFSTGKKIRTLVSGVGIQRFRPTKLYPLILFVPTILPRPLFSVSVSASRSTIHMVPSCSSITDITVFVA